MLIRPGLIALLLTIACTAPAFARGDAAAGEKVFNRCKTCHMTR